MLGTNAQNDFRMLYTIAGGVPLGICAMTVCPLTKKPGVRRFSFIGFSVGIAFGPVKNPGLIPLIYFAEHFLRRAGQCGKPYRHSDGWHAGRCVYWPAESPCRWSL